MKIVEESTRFVFREYTDDELGILRKLISANDSHYLYESDDWVGCPIGVERYIRRKFPTIPIAKSPAWDSAKMKVVPEKMPDPRDKLQKDALKFLREHRDRNQLGLITSPGSGKSFMGIRHAITVGEKALVVLPTTAILDQWKDTLVTMFGIPENRILHVNGTDRLIRMKGDWDWVLVLEQSLQSMMKNDKLEELLKDSRFGLKIIDEIHLFLRNNIFIDCCSNIKRSLYLTGTYFRTQPEESRLFDAVYGNILRFEVVDQHELEKYGQRKHINLYSMIINSRLTRKEVSNIIIHAKIGRHTVQTVSVGRYMNTVCPDNGKITEYMRQSIAVVKRMLKDVPYGRMLILVPSIYATKRFREILARIFPDKKVGCINSTQTRELNNQVKMGADIVVSTSKSCGVGFDMKDLSVLVAIEQFRSPVMVEQISGRLRPRSDGKDTYYVDIADSSLGAYLLRWRNERLEQLKKKSKSYKVFRITG